MGTQTIHNSHSIFLVFLVEKNESIPTTIETLQIFVFLKNHEGSKGKNMMNCENINCYQFS